MPPARLAHRKGKDSGQGTPAKPNLKGLALGHRITSVELINAGTLPF